MSLISESQQQKIDKAERILKDKVRELNIFTYDYVINCRKNENEFDDEWKNKYENYLNNAKKLNDIFKNNVYYPIQLKRMCEMWDMYCQLPFHVPLYSLYEDHIVDGLLNLK